jgi:MYXO-CTERM domain-containing protein
MRRAYFLGALSVGVVGAFGLLEGEAHACGGCFVPTEVESVITDEKMILSVSMNQTTLYDQINYSGNPASFAWVLPIRGQVTVGLSADIMFQVINQLTQTSVQAPPTNCPPPPSCGYGGGFSAPEALGAAADAGAAEDGTVTVTSQAQVGPYETVQLHSTDGSALTNWLTAHGYNIPDATKPIINDYVTQQFDFLALKLVPGQGVQSMQPVRVTSQGAAPSLPLHMVAIGTGPTTGITIWVVADGRWQPSNFPTFTIGASDIAWDWATSSSNYETVRLAKEATYGGRGWQIESSLELSQYTIQQSLGYNAAYDPTGGYLVGAAAGGGDGGVADAGAGDAGDDSGDDNYYGVDAGAQETAASLDLAVMFAGIAAPNVRITRMRSDVAQSALSVDMQLQASSDQTELSNTLVAQQEIGEPQCTIYSATTCEAIGTAPRSQAQAQAAAQASSVGGGGCATTPSHGNTRTTLALLFALGGITALRARKRRQR